MSASVRREGQGPWGQGSEFTANIPTPTPADEGADAASVELAAWRGLAVPRPQGEAVGIALLLDQVQRALPAPGAGGQELPMADRVLHQAQQTRGGTARAQGRAQDVQGVLAEAGAHTRAAEQGLQAARQTLGGLEASVQEVAGRLAQMTLAADVTPDPGLLSRAAVALRTRVALCQGQAQAAEERAAHALGLAGGLGKSPRGAEVPVPSWSLEPGWGSSQRIPAEFSAPGKLEGPERMRGHKIWIAHCLSGRSVVATQHPFPCDGDCTSRATCFGDQGAGGPGTKRPLPIRPLRPAS
ncbi:PREDICTED: uncharacterized protein LOC106725962 [Myotis brandtii]|uniref:uncharacterized protein LOC106725962 n=1 Tax=Myotis brandtii TaxID=109478 RepID=UPI000704310B|nr:PREDICTED: uncharacterized protein LOC106725962 [Myotis brandtii]